MTAGRNVKCLFLINSVLPNLFTKVMIWDVCNMVLCLFSFSLELETVLGFTCMCVSTRGIDCIKWGIERAQNFQTLLNINALLVQQNIYLHHMKFYWGNAYCPVLLFNEENEHTYNSRLNLMYYLIYRFSVQDFKRLIL